jgi:signal transduction histidine kinase
MARTGLTKGQLRLAAVFLLLVLLPSALLGWFCLRAVDSERRARQGRLLQEYSRYADFAARTVHQELSELEIAWQDLVPARPSAPPPPEDPLQDSAALVERYVRAAYVFGSGGPVVCHAPGEEPRMRPGFDLPIAEDAHTFEALLLRGEEAEFENGDARAAMTIYADMENRLGNRRLRAIAASSLARAALQAGEWDAALAAAQRVRAEPAALDLENQPLALVAGLQAARALASKGEPNPAAATLLEVSNELEAHSSELTPTQYEFLRSRIDESLAGLSGAVDAECARDLDARRAALRGRAKKPAGDLFLEHKLERRLWRAAMEDQLWSPRWRYISEVADGTPYLLAYQFLPDADGTRVAGLLGLAIDLPRVSSVLVPAFLQELELSEAAWLEVVDEAGHRVIAQSSASEPQGQAAMARTSLGEPFEFWSVAVHARTPPAAARALDFRTRVFLYLVLVLLLAIAAGAVLLVLELRREARLASLKTSFVSNVSHELRTPLTSIRMYAEMLESAGDRLPEAERRRQLAVIRSESGRLERLIDAVLDFATLHRGTKKYQFEFEEVGELVRAAAEDFRDQAEAQGFSYTVEVEGGLPEVRVDADAIRQVLLNLLSNAVKYSEDDRRITVRAFRRDDAVAVQVEDHGIGIAAAEQQRIFEDFYRVDARLSSARQGVGLGLTLVRRIVEAHGGRVAVESALGRGARFTVWLPVEPAERGAEPSPGGHVPQEA